MDAAAPAVTHLLRYRRQESVQASWTAPRGARQDNIGLPQQVNLTATLYYSTTPRALLFQPDAQPLRLRVSALHTPTPNLRSIILQAFADVVPSSVGYTEQETASAGSHEPGWLRGQASALSLSGAIGCSLPSRQTSGKPQASRAFHILPDMESELKPIGRLW